MAVQLPDFTTVGAVNPQPVSADSPYRLARFKPGNPMAAAEAQAGRGLQQAGRAVETAGAYNDMAQLRMDRAMAGANFATSIADLEGQLRGETDPAKIAAIGQQYQAALQKAGGAIRDPAAAKLWMAENQHVVASGQKAAELRNLGISRQSYAVNVMEQANGLARAGAADPRSFALADGTGEGSIADLYDSAVQSGAMTPEQAYAQRKATQKQLYAGRADYLIGAGQPQAAVAFLDQHREDLDPTLLESLRFRAQHATDKLGIQSDINATWGGADKGYAGSRRYGAGLPSPGDATVDDPRGMIPVITAAATKYGIDPQVAIRAAQPEGLANFLGDNGTSGGAFQLHVTGPNGSALGDQFKRDTGLNPLDPKNEAATIDYAMSRLAETGWTPYRGAIKAGIGPREGIGAAPQRAGGGAPAGPAAPGNIDLAGQSSAPGLAPLPDINAMLQGVQDRADRGEITQERADAVQAGLRSRYNHVQAAQAADRAVFAKSLQDGVAMLADGRDFAYDPAAVRHYFPPAKADEVLQQLQDAKDGGQLVAGLRTASPADIATQRAQLAAKLNDPTGADYARNRRMLMLFDQALKQHEAALIGPKADPVGYLAQYDPVIAAKRSAIDPQKPQTFQDFAATALSEQTRLGVPPEQQHIVSADAAQQIAAAIDRDPEHAPATMQALSTQYGSTWPHLWSDLVTLGKLPAGYQVVGQLADYDPANAAVLSRALGATAKDDKAFKALVSVKAPGGKSIEDVAQQTIPVDERVSAYERSLSDSGASPGQVVAVRSAIEHLAAGRAIFLHEDPAEAAEKAIDAVVGHYEFMPNGGARVPTDKFAAVSYAAGTTLAGLSLGNIAVPPRYGSSPDMPKPQEYIDMVKAAPTWITGRKADRLLLIDPGGAPVKGSDGQPIAVPFNVPPPPLPTVPAGAAALTPF